MNLGKLNASMLSVIASVKLLSPAFAGSNHPSVSRGPCEQMRLQSATSFYRGGIVHVCKLLHSTLLVLIAAVSLPSLAQEAASTVPAAVVLAMAVEAKSVAANSLTDGEIRKVDKEGKKLTIKHEEIKNLDMPKMTMVFQVKDAAMLEKLKTGDKVKFSVEQNGGAMLITEIVLNQ